jgi:hypothetical protein
MNRKISQQDLDVEIRANLAAAGAPEPKSLGEVLHSLPDRSGASHRVMPAFPWLMRYAALGLVVALAAAAIGLPLMLSKVGPPAESATPNASQLANPSTLATGWATNTPPGSPDLWTEEPSVFPSEAPSTPAPTQLTGTRAPRVLSKLDCTLMDYSARQLRVVSGGVIYLSCETGLALPDDLTEIRAFNATTGKLVGTYRYSTGGVISELAVDQGIWVSSAAVPEACPDTGCPPFNPTVYKMDPASRKVTFTLPGWWLVGDGGGYIWAESYALHVLMRIDPATNQTSQIPWPYARTEFSCGMVWGLDATTDSGQAATKLARVDPASGDASQTYTVPGDIVSLHQDGEGCWGVTMVPETVASASPAPSPTGGQRGTYRYFRIDASGVHYPGLAYPTDANGGHLVLLDTTAWMSWAGGYDSWTSLQRLDPATGQLVGPTWALQTDPDVQECGGGYDMADVFEAGGSLWLPAGVDCLDDVWRLDIPLDPLPS